MSRVEYFLELKSELKIINERLYGIEKKFQSEEAEKVKLSNIPFLSLRQLTDFDPTLEANKTLAETFVRFLHFYNFTCYTNCLQILAEPDVLHWRLQRKKLHQ